ncbi:MAG: beta-N-acetylhexosaminidase [Clostridia bacterium]|jgi:beta-N-acetylhexosaminidase
MHRRISASVIVLILFFVFTGCEIIMPREEENPKPNPTESNDEKPGEVAEPENQPKERDTLEQQVKLPEEKKDPIQEQIQQMTLKEKVGQMVIVGMGGFSADDEIRELIESYHVGGVILFKSKNVENANQLLALLNTLKTINAPNKIPLFLSTDEEGGRVSRMPDELEDLPRNKKVGRINNPAFSYGIGTLLAEQLLAFGFNMNFAPILDINSNPNNPVIGDRSFGDDADIVSELGVQTMKGIQSKGVISVVKHFPGHGDTSVDSHVGLPRVNNGLDRLERLELVPFKKAIQSNADAVMVAHILLTKIDPEYPSSMSKVVITDILRNKLEFNGVVLTDDMTMGAISENYETGEAAVRSINAGADIVLVCHGYSKEKAVLQAIVKAVADGTLSEGRINESVYRILSLKKKYGLSDKTIDEIDIEAINEHIRNLLKQYMN